MFHSRLPRSRWSISFRRLCALLALVGIAFALVERVFPDVHDGDADSVTAHVQSVGDDGVAERGGVPGPEGRAPNHGPTTPSGPIPHHGPHVDHCGHAHGMTFAALRAPAPTAVPAHERIDTVSQRLASVSMPPHQRPPIA